MYPPLLHVTMQHHLQEWAYKLLHDLSADAAQEFYRLRKSNLPIEVLVRKGVRTELTLEIDDDVRRYLRERQPKSEDVHAQFAQALWEECFERQIREARAIRRPMYRILMPYYARCLLDHPIDHLDITPEVLRHAPAISCALAQSKVTSVAVFNPRDPEGLLQLLTSIPDLQKIVAPEIYACVLGALEARPQKTPIEYNTRDFAFLNYVILSKWFLRTGIDHVQVHLKLPLYPPNSQMAFVKRYLMGQTIIALKDAPAILQNKTDADERRYNPLPCQNCGVPDPFGNHWRWGYNKSAGEPDPYRKHRQQRLYRDNRAAGHFVCKKAIAPPPAEQHDLSLGLVLKGKAKAVH